jgi:hypothetical protein
MRILKYKIKELFRALILFNKHWCIKATDKNMLTEFFNQIRPINCGYSLIRIGGESDGGYLIPDDLEGIKYCFSPGVGYSSDFEFDLAKRGIKCFLADNSVPGPVVSHSLFDFEKKHLGVVNNANQFTLEEWVKLKAPLGNDLILQIDIEGAEYPILLTVPESLLDRFRIIVIEFHDLRSLINSFGFQFIDTVFKKLLKNFEIVHIHPNNCLTPIEYEGYLIPSVMEFTFLRKDRIRTQTPANVFPHRLDRKTVKHLEDFALPKCWYQSTR